MKYNIMNAKNMVNTTFTSDDKCPCGSDKTFKECCELTYDFMGYNYKEVPVLINKYKTECAGNELNLFSQKEILNAYNEKNGITIRQGLDILENLYILFDKNFKEQSKYSSCKKGCSGKCCDLIVECTPIEAELIRRYIRRNFSKEDIERIQMYNKENIKHMPKYMELKNNEELKNTYYSKNIKCMFLNMNNECSIYDVRPFTCRHHIVFSSPKQCEPGQNEDRYIGSISLLMEMFLRNISKGVYKEEFVMNYFGQIFFNIKALPLWFEEGFGKINFTI